MVDISRRDTLGLLGLAVGGDWTGVGSLADGDRDAGDGDTGERENDLL
jgi:hypothetical protein